MHLAPSLPIQRLYDMFGDQELREKVHEAEKKYLLKLYRKRSLVLDMTSENHRLAQGKTMENQFVTG
jgi:hypothetical protein